MKPINAFSQVLIALLAVSLLTPVAHAAGQKSEVPPVVLITNVDVWDGTSDVVEKDLDVLVVGNKIKRIGKDIPRSATYTVDSDEGTGGVKTVSAHVVDGQGGTITPGLIDMHQHLTLNGGTSAGTYDWDA